MFQFFHNKPQGPLERVKHCLLDLIPSVVYKHTSLSNKVLHNVFRVHFSHRFASKENKEYNNAFILFV